MEKGKLKEQICKACKSFYRLGWVSGTGGGMSIKTGDTALIAPSGVDKESLNPEDIFEVKISDASTCSDYEVVDGSENSEHKLSACTPLFFAAYLLRDAGAVIHSHSINAFLASRISILETNDSKNSITLQRSIRAKNNAAIGEILLTKMEMLKGISGLEYESVHRIPVIANTAQEAELKESLEKAIQEYPEAYAVVVENHGVYTWGKDASEAKRHAECYDYLLHAYVRMYELSLERIEFIGMSLS